MNYILKQFDEPLVKFSATTDTSEPEIQILWTNEEKAAFLPLGLTLTPDGLSRWLRRRTIPKNRAYVHSLLAKCGLNINRPLSIISICKGLSLNDCYWVIGDGDTASFDKANLYDNPFSNVLAELAFTGYGSSVRTSLLSSPEFTTNGMLRKCWRRMGGKVYLYKGGTEGAANTGNEPYSEFYAAQIAAAMGIHAIPYGLSRWKGVLCSTCELFTDKAYAYLPIGQLVSNGGMEAVKAYYEKLGTEFVNALNEMPRLIPGRAGSGAAGIFLRGKGPGGHGQELGPGQGCGGAHGVGSGALEDAVARGLGHGDIGPVTGGQVGEGCGRCPRGGGHGQGQQARQDQCADSLYRVHALSLLYKQRIPRPGRSTCFPPYRTR